MMPIRSKAAIIDVVNTELINILESIGYTQSKFSDPKGDCICTSPATGNYTILSHKEAYTCTSGPKTNWAYCRVNCGKDEDLFIKTITSLEWNV